jgi:hypothetical protein
MTISNERLLEFMRLYQEEFGKAIDEGEAREVASRLVELYHLLAERLPGEEAPEEREKDAGQAGSAHQ